MEHTKYSKITTIWKFPTIRIIIFLHTVNFLSPSCNCPDWIHTHPIYASISLLYFFYISLNGLGALYQTLTLQVLTSVLINRQSTTTSIRPLQIRYFHQMMALALSKIYIMKRKTYIQQQTAYYINLGRLYYVHVCVHVLCMVYMYTYELKVWVIY